MERRKFIKNCCYSLAVTPVIGSVLQSCSTIYYAKAKLIENRLVIARSEFIEVKKNKQKKRSFVLLEPKSTGFPICVYNTKGDNFVASLLECTHRSCELNVGGGIYSCPCHGSEFSTEGKLLEGPADRDLKTFKIKTDSENIYVLLS